MTLLSGCMIPSVYEFAQYRREYQAQPGSTPDCIAAAEQARRWCKKEPTYRGAPEDKLCTAKEFEYEAECFHPEVKPLNSVR